jgi:RND family efflux transporter MFP subunit
MKILLKTVFLLLFVLGIASLSKELYQQLKEHTSEKKAVVKTQKGVPVEVAPIQQGAIELHRTFSGTLEANAQFVVAPKVSGRVKRIHVNLADTVTRGQVVAELDNDEYLQAIAQAKTDLAVSKAKQSEAQSALEVSLRELERITLLRKKELTSESEFDVAKVNQFAKQAQLDVATAQVLRSESSLETTNIRLGYTQITADWTGGNPQRVVAERYVDEGETVSANTPLLLIVEQDPIKAIIFIAEKDYGRLQVGQVASLLTDAYPQETFQGKIERISPIFQKNTRQARIEMSIPNPKQRLKSGMFVRVNLILERQENTTIIPAQALTYRKDQAGVFMVEKDSVVWRTVQVGIREGERLQVTGEGLSGFVVTLGQHFIENGSRISIPEKSEKKSSSTEKAYEQ